MNINECLDKESFASEEARALLRTTQGHILEKHRRECVWNLLLRFHGGAAEALANLPVASVEDLRTHAGNVRRALAARGAVPSADPVCFLGLSSPGCHALGLNPRLFVLPFYDGFRQRSNKELHLSDSDWDEAVWKGERYDGVLVCAGETDESLDTFRDKLERQFKGRVSVSWIDKCRVKRTPSETRGQAIEHFGFADGISQPVFFPDDTDNRKGGWRSQYNPCVPLARAVIEDPLAAGNNNPNRHYGSFMAYLDIEQHVDEFDRAVSQLAEHVSPPAGSNREEYAGALIVGRYKNGQPVIPGCAHPNDFDRQSDAQAGKWAFASHSCKMNAREAPVTERRFIVRRGVTYERDDRVGLIFQSFQASLTAQFETLLVSWAANPHHPRTATGADPVLGNLKDLQCYPTSNGFSLCISGLTTIRGGEYFYFPSIPGIRKLATS